MVCGFNEGGGCGCFVLFCFNCWFGCWWVVVWVVLEAGVVGCWLCAWDVCFCWLVVCLLVGVLLHDTVTVIGITRVGFWVV